MKNFLFGSKAFAAFPKLALSLFFIFLLVSCGTKETVRKDFIESDLSETLDTSKVKQPEPATKQDLSEVKDLKQQEQIRIEKEAEEKFVILNFDDADIRTVVSAIGEMLNINYVLAPGVAGKVTIQSYKKFPVKDVFQVFQAILELNALTAVKNGAIYEVVPIDIAKQRPLSVQSGREVKFQVDSGFLTQIVPLEYTKANDVVNILRNLMPKGADFVVYEPSNLLIVTCPPASLVKFMKIIEAIDILSTEREAIKTFVYNVNNGEAKKLADILKSLYEKAGAPVKTALMPSKSGPVPQPMQSPPTVRPNIEGLAGDVEGEISILAYEDINALIIRTSPRNYLTILDLLKKLDVSPKQAMIEVLIAEVSLTDTTKVGIEWMLKSPVSIGGKHITGLSGFTTESLPGAVAPIITAAGEVTNIMTTPSVGTAFAAIINPQKYGAILNAFSSLGKVNVLSSPLLLAIDNKEAKIEIGENVPIATGFQQQPSTTTTTGTVSFVAAGQIEYKPVGVILTVTPRISEKGRVMLKITQEISSQGPDVALAGITSPSFVTRKAQTTGIVQSGHTLVIGGIITEQKNVAKEGIPFLSRIPLLGFLFGANTDTVKKTELIIMVTPTVIESTEDIDAITKGFQNRVKIIKERLGEGNKKEDNKLNESEAK
ncbi:MAG: hypothetical protein CVV37_04675 [Nitrospira bacterium HGW-Nitrospira-1]|nr:MAG: hypothetical protein CVV37_04675 [Nitrospira bacterium HGW-Nitrospira-1]